LEGDESVSTKELVSFSVDLSFFFFFFDGESKSTKELVSSFSFFFFLEGESMPMRELVSSIDSLPLTSLLALLLFQELLLSDDPLCLSDHPLCLSDDPLCLSADEREVSSADSFTPTTLLFLLRLLFLGLRLSEDPLYLSDGTQFSSTADNTSLLLEAVEPALLGAALVTVADAVGLPAFVFFLLVLVAVLGGADLPVLSLFLLLPFDGLAAKYVSKSARSSSDND
jgi:hypothetical protein